MTEARCLNRLRIYLLHYSSPASCSSFVGEKIQPATWSIKSDKGDVVYWPVPIPESKSGNEESQFIGEEENWTYFESEQKIVNRNKKLIEIFQNKISAAISALWA